MKQTILLLTACLLACGQPSTSNKQDKDTSAVINGTSETSDVADAGNVVAENAIDEDDFAGQKAALDNLFLLNKDSTAFSSEGSWTEIQIGYLFDKEHKDAVLRYSENDSVANVIVLRERGKNWDTIIAEKLYDVATDNRGNFIEVGDFNGDNIPDLKAVRRRWDFHAGDLSVLWVYNGKSFTKIRGFDEIVSASYYKKTDMVYAYQSLGCADMAMYFGVFKIVGDTVQRVKEMSCDCCSESGDSCEIKVNGETPFKVVAKNAYKYVPDLFAEGVKEKVEMGEGK